MPPRVTPNWMAEYTCRYPLARCLVITVARVAVNEVGDGTLYFEVSGDVSRVRCPALRLFHYSKEAFVLKYVIIAAVNHNPNKKLTRYLGVRGGETNV